jgi:hypothetical protein
MRSAQEFAAQEAVAAEFAAQVRCREASATAAASSSGSMLAYADVC